MGRTLLLSPERVRRTLDRIAHEVIERTAGGERLIVFGIETRGQALAAHLARGLTEIAGRPIAAHPLDTRPFRDDLDDVAPPARSTDPDVEGKDVLVVDDVLFTGRTARAAIEAVLHHGRPRTLQLAVLVDRGHREFPIQPDYVGRSIPTKHRERVVVEVEGSPAVYLEE